MSATIIAFPTKQTSRNLLSTGHCIDISPVDKRGFVILDACVPFSLSVELLPLFDIYEDKPVARVRGGVPAYDRPAYSFEMIQLEAHGPVLIDACVPEQLAKDFLALAEMSAAA
jgi:hypothetical protein